jgi:hypothetical protein
LTNPDARSVFLGYNAGYFNNGANNVAIGHGAGVNHTGGQYNTYIGNAAGAGNFGQSGGDNNTCIGDGAGYQSTGSFNMMLGVHAGFFNSTGSNNVMIGGDAGKFNTDGNFNTFIGVNANVSQSATNLTNATAIGYNAIATRSNTMILGNNDVSVGIGTSNPQYKLAVNGIIGAREVRVTVDGWADFVFDPGYKLTSLNELETYVKKNKHLPNIPSARAVQEQGIGIGEMNVMLLQKIEELTLHIINQQKQIDELKIEKKSSKKHR